MSRRFKQGDRVTSRIRRGHKNTFTTGRIATTPVFDNLAGRCCLVFWDDDTESLVCTSDLRHDYSDTLVDVSKAGFLGRM